MGILGPRGNKESNFTCGIGNALNNQEEIHALQLGTRITHERGIKKLVVVRDSMIIFLHMINSSLLKDLTLSRILDQLQIMSKEFESILFIHTLRNCN